MTSSPSGANAKIVIEACTFLDKTGEKRWSDLMARMVEHNIRMMAL